MNYLIPFVIGGTIAFLLYLIVRLTGKIGSMQRAGRDIMHSTARLHKIAQRLDPVPSLIDSEARRIDFLLAQFFDISLMSKTGDSKNELLYFIISKLDFIMDQNKVITDALDLLGVEVGEIVTELGNAAGGVKPGMTDEQAQEAADRITALAARLKAAEIPKASEGEGDQEGQA